MMKQAADYTPPAPALPPYLAASKVWLATFTEYGCTDDARDRADQAANDWLMKWKLERLDQ